MTMEWLDKPVGDCSHIYSDGRNVPVLFETDLDKVEGKNLIAVTALETDVMILMEVVMTTHFHAVTAGKDTNRERFKNEMERKLMIRASRLGLKIVGDSKIHVRKDDIRTETELKDKIMYDYRNPIAAGLEMMPWHYSGGPGDIFFSDHKSKMAKGRLINELPVLTRRKVFHTKTELPAEWRYADNYEIIPDCYVDWQRLERLFKSPRAVLAFLHQSKEKEMADDAECSREFIRKLGEKELRHIARDYCHILFRKEYVNRLTDQEKIVIAQKMWTERDTYSISALSRATQMDKHILESILIPQK